jgi:hypothetical protein
MLIPITVSAAKEIKAKQEIERRAGRSTSS